MATTNTFNTSASNGMLFDRDGTYSVAHDKAVSDYLWTNTTLIVGQNTNYDVHRSFLYFDTSSIPDDAVVISAKIRLKAADLDHDAIDNFNIVIRRNTAGTYPSNPLVKADFDYTFYTGDGGSINIDDVSSTGLTYIYLNSTGLDWISKTGVTKLVLVSSQDINAITPTGLENCKFRTYYYGAAEMPQLSVTYAIEQYPTVTTQVATNIKDFFVKGNGNLTDGLIATEYGFEYGLTETPTWKVSSTKNVAEGAFSLSIDGVEPETTYYYRAYATNSYGTAYGLWESFTTGASPSYGLYEEDNTATICFYISEDDGKTWGQKHGPYTTDQADIEITKLLVRGSGKKKIKFESDVLTGISASVMVKLDLRAR